MRSARFSGACPLLPESDSQPPKCVPPRPLPDSCAATKSGQCRDCGSGIQLIEQRLRFLQIERIEALGEPAVDRRDKITSLIPFALVTPQPRHAHRRTEFPGFGLLRASYVECA